ncbi:kynurenine 3-monooxygenase [Phyllosticta capitalensis]|uniref:Kynurenine 3-monooxygenase n=1 Tax=Phyllosticta capitalensis TaxID=121624 RepID=A0ABR1YRL5_9PEZI
MVVQKTVVVGAGPVGALAAIYAARRGDEVEIYELRGDLRDPDTTLLNFTRSINLALSERGINSMRKAECPGLLESVLDETIPMYGRMIHGSQNGQNTQEAQLYDVRGRFLRAIDRSSLNTRLLDELESMPNVKFFFHHKLVGADFKNNVAWFEHLKTAAQQATSTTTSSGNREVEVKFDLMIGADGAHSAVRYHMMKYARMDYMQEYIDTLWCEFRMDPAPHSENDGFKIPPNYLHIWPGKEFMFIAIPSLDKSFTCTLFLPADGFAELDANPDRLVPFFQKHFPGVVPDLISEEALQRQFSENPHLPLISIKCSPYHYGSSAVILGDAAHAMVPFYGQGMNAGLEDVRVLYDCLDQFSPPADKEPETATALDASNYALVNGDPVARTNARARALDAYSALRRPDAHTINDLALRNYVEMRSDVTSPLYRLRKAVEEWLSVRVPSLGFATQYSRVTFGNERYSDVKQAVVRQSQVLLAAMLTSTVAAAGWVAWVVWRLERRSAARPSPSSVVGGFLGSVGKSISDFGRRLA